MSLLSLPAELQLEIFSYLAPYGNLDALCLTSKTIRALAEVHLYSEIRLAFFCEEPPEECEIVDPRPPIHSYFASIWNRPLLASYVKHAHFEGFEQFRDKIHLWDIPPPDNLVQSWVAAVDQLGVPQRTKLKLAALVRVGDAVALGTILISRLINLERLTVVSTFARPPSLLGQVIKYATSSGAAPTCSQFRNLKRLHVLHEVDNTAITLNSPLETWHMNHRSDESETSFACRQAKYLAKMVPSYFDDTLSLWHNPMLEDVSLVLEPNGDKAISNLKVDLPISLFPRLTKLHLLDWGNNEAVLTRLFSSMPSIEHVHYFRAVNVDSLISEENWEQDYCNDWDKFFNSLQATVSSLKSLTVSIDTTEDIMDGPSEELPLLFDRMGRNLIAPLTGFCNLRRLEIPIFVLLGWVPPEDLYSPGGHTSLASVLPPTLEELCIRHDLIHAEDQKWSPWDFNGDELPHYWPERFENTVDFHLYLEVFRRYLSAPRHNLKTLCLKTTEKRKWPSRELVQLAQICAQHSVQLVTSVRHSLEDEWRSTVESFVITLDDENHVHRSCKVLTTEPAGAFWDKYMQ